MVDRRTFLRAALYGGVVGTAAWRAGALTAQSGALLYNGIRLPDSWPPLRDLATMDQELRPPYLVAPPQVIPIDVGRQLFVDDFLIEESSLRRVFHSATYEPHNPILTPTEPWERVDDAADRNHEPMRQAAMVYSDGVVFDPIDRLFKMWYQASYGGVTCHAVSEDGHAWRKPVLDVVPGTNIVLNEPRDSSTVWLDHEDRDAQRRYKAMLYMGRDRRVHLHGSPDGVHWLPLGVGGPSGDRSTMFYNPFRRVWVFSIRDDDIRNKDGTKIAGRYRRYWESPMFGGPSTWDEHSAVPWVAADHSDRARPDLRSMPELYNLDCVAYESVLLGLFTMYYGQGSDRHKPNDLRVGFSRDGFHWTRAREPFLAVSEHRGDWNWTNVQSAGGCCLVVGDTLYFYVSGRSGVPKTSSAGVCATGLATLRRDGFASLEDAETAAASSVGRLSRPHSITTRPVRFEGAWLFVNADVRRGELRVEILDRAGRVIPPFTAARCVPIRGDSTRQSVAWSGAPSLSELAGHTVRFRIYVRSGRLFSFWVSHSPQAESNGYVAAGGPGFDSAVDAEPTQNIGERHAPTP